MTFVRGLVCRECGRGVPPSPVHVCESCFGPLEVDYDYPPIRAVLTRERIAAGPPSIWRYRDLLPLDGEPLVGHHVGWTPLVRARNLGDALGLRELYLKNDAVCHPTWSFKDRVVSVAVSKARELGLDTVACASTGNLANSVAAHAAEAGLPALVFIPVGLETGKVLGTLVYGPVVFAVEGTYDDVNRFCSELADRHPWAFVNVNLRPYYAEGSKTVGYEIAEQLGWRAPGHVVVPCAGGALLTKIHKAFSELADLGLIAPRPARMHAAQAAGCGPIVTMIRDGADTLVPVRPRTVAKSLAIGNPADGYYAAHAVRESGGWAAHATDEEILEAMELLARTEGIFAETAGGVTLAATRTLVAEGRIGRDQPVVVCITGKRSQDHRSPGAPAGGAGACRREPVRGGGRAAGAPGDHHALGRNQGCQCSSAFPCPSAGTPAGWGMSTRRVRTSARWSTISSGSFPGSATDSATRRGTSGSSSTST
jgi:threonine synthase